MNAVQTPSRNAGIQISDTTSTCPNSNELFNQLAFHNTEDKSLGIFARAFRKISPDELNPRYFIGEFKGRQISPDLRVYDSAPGSKNKFGQPLIKLSGISLLRGANCSTLLSNLQQPKFKGANDAYKNVLTRHLGSLLIVIEADQILEMAKAGVSGFFMRDNVVSHSFLGLSLPYVEPEIILRQGESWQPEAGYPVQPFMVSKKSALYPLLGTFYIGGKELSQEDLDRLGFVSAGMHKRTEKGKPNDGPPDITNARLPMFAWGGRSLLLVASQIIPARRTKEGGLEFAPDSCQNKDAKEHMVPLPTVAFQFVGAGCHNYVYHAASIDPLGKVDLKEGESIIENEETENQIFAVVQRHVYAGKSGIFLDQRHQEMNASPTGGLATWEKAIRNDALLWRRGAYLGAVTLASLPILRRTEVDALLGKQSDMVVPEIRIAVRAVFDDTHRLTTIVGTESDFVLEVHGSAFKRLIERDYGKYTDSFRDQYLQRLAGNLGKNLRVTLTSGLVLPEEQSLFDNLNIYGGLVDCDNYMERSNRYQILPLIEGFHNAFLRAAEVAGLSRRETLDSQGWRTFVCSAFGDECYKRIVHRLKAKCSDRGFKNGAALIFSGEWIEKEMQSEGVKIDCHDLLERVLSDKKLRKMVLAHWDKSFLDVIRASVKSLAPQPIVVCSRDYKGRMRVNECSLEDFCKEYLLWKYVVLAVRESLPTKLAQRKSEFKLVREVLMK